VIERDQSAAREIVLARIATAGYLPVLRTDLADRNGTFVEVSVIITD
jgi:hypothetical protein